MPDPPISHVPDAPLPYLVSVPDAAPPSGGWPVLCFLHGYGEGAPMEIRAALTRHGPLREGSAPAARRDLIVVAPQLPARGDLWTRYGPAVLEVVRRVLGEHAGDPGRSYLTGFSFGGNGVFDLALTQPGMWAALWPVDPTRVPPADPGAPVWLSSGEVSRRGERAFVDRLSLAPPADPAPGDRVLVDYGADHVGTATAAYADERIYRWLLGR
jgi:poly(3-hydroxybutyrate) depolymerase